MSALYLSMSWAQAASLPERHSFTRRVSFHFIARLSGAMVLGGLIEGRSPVQSSDKAAPHSKEHRVRERRDGSCRRNFWRPPGCPDWPKKSWVDIRREFPVHDRRVSFSVRRCVQTSGLRRGGRFPLPTELRDAVARGSRDACRRWRAKR